MIAALAGLGNRLGGCVLRGSGFALAAQDEEGGCSLPRPRRKHPPVMPAGAGIQGTPAGTRSAATAHPGSPSLAPEPALGRAFGPTRGALAGDDRVRERHRSASGHAPPLPRPRHRAGRVMCPSRGHAASPLLPTLRFVSGPLRDEGWRALKRRHASLVLWGASPAPAATISGLRHPRSTGERNDSLVSCRP